jgi:hypothetical protein
MFDFEIWSYSYRGYNLDRNQFLDICVIQSTCNVFMYLGIVLYNYSFIEKNNETKMSTAELMTFLVFDLINYI